MQASVPQIARRPSLWLVAVGLAVAVGLGLLALRPVFATASSAEPRVSGFATSPASRIVPPVSLVPEGLAWSRPPAPARLRPAAPEPKRAFLTARVVGGSVALRAAPGGPIVAALGETTEFGSPQTLSVVERRGRWLGVVSPLLENGEVGWIDSRAGALELARTSLEIRIDLSRRELVLRRGDEVLRRFEVGIGQPGSPTPTGRFAVTDKLDGARFSPVYGCCILALAARQPNLPAGWTGGDRIAIHGTSDPGTVGRATSAGCLHAGDRDLRALMRTVPLGTPVVIHP